MWEAVTVNHSGALFQPSSENNLINVGQNPLARIHAVDNLLFEIVFGADRRIGWISNQLNGMPQFSKSVARLCH